MGLAVGVSALLLTLFILNGFERVISDKISEFDGHVRIRHFLNEPISAKLTTIDSALINYNDGLILSSFIQRPALLRKGNLAEGVIVEGIHNEQADFINNMLVQGNLNFDNKSVVLGKRLAEQLKLSVGQKVQFSGRGKTVKGRLTKINLKTAVVSESNSPNKWKVSISMLEAA